MAGVAEKHLTKALKRVVNDTREEPESIGVSGNPRMCEALANTKED